jgi:hypothetical protein
LSWLIARNFTATTNKHNWHFAELEVE